MTGIQRNLQSALKKVFLKKKRRVLFTDANGQLGHTKCYS